MALQIGQRVVAIKNTAICSVGERGIVYELYQYGECIGASIIFERGGYDGFSEAEQRDMIHPLHWSEIIQFDNDSRDYKFTNVIQLRQDFLNHCFKFFDKGEK